MSNTAPQSKPFPMPGTQWQWMGNDMMPDVGIKRTVGSLRWFCGNVEAMFTNGGCAGVTHMMTNDAWQYCGTVDAHKDAPAQSTQHKRDASFEARWSAASCDALGDISATGVGCCGDCYSSQGPCEARGNCDCHTKDGRPVTR